MKDSLLCHDVANHPSMQAVLECLSLNFHLEGGKFLRLYWAVQSQLHGNLHHKTTEHESRISPLACCWKRPCAQHTECFNNSVVLGHTGNCGPQKSTEGSGKGAEEPRFRGGPSASHTDDRPCQQRTSVEIHLRGFWRVQKRKKRVIVIEVSPSQVSIEQMRQKGTSNAYCSNSRATRARERAISSNLHGLLSSWDRIDPSLCMVIGVAIDACCSTGTDTGRERSAATESRLLKPSSEH